MECRCFGGDGLKTKPEKERNIKKENANLGIKGADFGGFFYYNFGKITS
jgi:hypothetical protein